MEVGTQASRGPTVEGVEGADQMPGWTLWTRPRGAVAFMLGFELLTVALAAWAVSTHPTTQRDVAHFLVIAVLGVAAAEVSRHVERLRRRLAETPHVNLTSVWTL